MGDNNRMRPEETWDAFWKSYSFGKEYDCLSVDIFKQLLKAGGTFKDKNVLECGSGTGKISALIAQDKGNAYLLDYSPRAIELSKQFFNVQNLHGNFSEASMFAIPYADETFDMVWNSGVLEHFSEEKQREALLEMKRVCKRGGLIILINPFAYAYIYRLGKYCAEKTGKWLYGDEFPVKTLQKMTDTTSLALVSEYSFGFYSQLNFLQYVPLCSVFKRIIPLCVSEKLGQSIFNGYLLMSVFVK